MSKESYKSLNLVSLGFVFFWVLTLLGLLFWAEYKEEKNVIEYAKKEAKANLNKDVALRNWLAERGGVYVKVNDKTQPNPYLSHISDRDIIMSSGETITLMNPAYLLRQTMQEYGDLYGIKGKITSLVPLNPKNIPDEWESKILKQFETGDLSEVFEVINLENKPHLRYMQAFVAQEPCLKCQLYQGYKVGNVSGGIGVSVPLESYIDIKNKTTAILRFSYGSLLLIGLMIIGFIHQVIKRKIKLNLEVESKLITARKKAQQLSMHDTLTNLPNRRYFREYIENKLAQAERNIERVAFLYIDLDGFKAVNDNLSHHAGDEVLITLAQRFTKIIRKNEFMARIGGDEFCIVVYGYKDKQELKIIAKRLISECNQPMIIDDVDISIGMTIGVSCYPDDGKTYDELLSASDIAMYKGKNNNRGACVFSS